MKAGFRGWIYRWIALWFGLLGILVFLSGSELSRFYGFTTWSGPALTGLSLSYLLFTSALLSTWSWKRYSILSLIGVFVLGLPYLVFRPEMFRDDVLKQLENPPLSVDLVFYRGIALRDDPERELKIDRLRFIYGFIHTYGSKPTPPQVEPIPNHG